MIDESTLAAAEQFARDAFAGDASGHDWHHTLRVRRLAETIAADEGADLRVVALAALLHDVDDAKVSPATSERLDNARAFLAEQGVGERDAEQVLDAIREVSFSKNGGACPSSLEAACVRDADRLDAIGAIGVARAFAYGGSTGRAMHDPTGDDRTTTIQHFHDKLLLLRDLMCTDAGRRIAEARHEVTQAFLDEFLLEWDGAR